MNSCYTNATWSAYDDCTGLNDKTPYYVLPLIVSPIGVVAHGLVVACSIKAAGSQKRPVFYVIASISLSECLVCGCDGVWYPLGLLVKKAFVYGPFYFIAIAVIYVSDCCDLLLAVNRFLAVFGPFHYKTVFTTKLITVYIGISWIVGFAFTIPMVAVCHLSTDISSWFSAFDASYDLCAQIIIYTDILFVGITVAAVLLNVVTFLRLRKQTSKVAHSMTQQQAKTRAQNEMSFIILALAVSTTSLLTIIFADVVSSLFTNPLATYASAVFVPLFFYSVDGIDLLLLNEVIRSAALKYVRRFGGKL